MKNESGIHPSEYKVLIRPKAIEDKSKGGIILPDVSKEREQYAMMEGELIEASPLAFTYDDWKGAQPPKAGDRVIFAKYAGAIVKGRDSVEYRIANDKDIVAVLA